MEENFKCANCGGEIAFDPKKQKLVCKYCLSEFAVGDVAQNDNIFLMYSDDLKYEGCKDAKRLYKCNICKTHLASCDDMDMVRCPSCGSVDLSKSQANGIHPMNIIPFALSKNQAAEIFQKWIKSRKFAPNDLKKMAKLKKLSGMYIPLYGFNLDARTSYSATGVDLEEYEDSEGRRKTRVKDRDYVSDVEHRTFENFLVSANKNVQAKVIKKFGGYNLEGIKKYSTNYMLGFIGVGTDINVQEAYELAKKGVAQEEHSRIYSQLNVKYDRVDFFNSSTTVDNVFNAYYYAPIWANHYKYKNKEYHCYINGQTGKIYGKAPKSLRKIFGLIFGILAGLASIVAFYFIIFLLVGSLGPALYFNM